MTTLTSNQLMRKIKDYLPNELIKFSRHEITGDIQIIFTNRKSIMTVLKDNTWDEIKRHIDAKMNNNQSGECSICSSTEMIKIRRVSCPKCACDWCVDCYINIFRTNKGIIKCPFCRYSYGQQFLDHMVEMGVQQILSSL
jgi:hypothetical protein